MKRLLAIIATALTGLFAAPDKAEAGHPPTCHTYRSGYSSCGCPIYTKRYFRGYDCYRRPVYCYVQVPVSHGSSCRSRSHHHGYSHGLSRTRYSHYPNYSSRTGYRYSPRLSFSYRSGYSRCR